MRPLTGQALSNHNIWIHKHYLHVLFLCLSTFLVNESNYLELSSFPFPRQCLRLRLVRIAYMFCVASQDNCFTHPASGTKTQMTGWLTCLDIYSTCRCTLAVSGNWQFKIYCDIDLLFRKYSKKMYKTQLCRFTNERPLVSVGCLIWRLWLSLSRQFWPLICILVHGKNSNCRWQGWTM